MQFQLVIIHVKRTITHVAMLKSRMLWKRWANLAFPPYKLITHLWANFIWKANASSNDYRRCWCQLQQWYSYTADGCWVMQPSFRRNRLREIGHNWSVMYSSWLSSSSEQLYMHVFVNLAWKNLAYFIRVDVMRWYYIKCSWTQWLFLNGRLSASVSG